MMIGVLVTSSRQRGGGGGRWRPNGGNGNDNDGSGSGNNGNSDRPQQRRPPMPRRAVGYPARVSRGGNHSIARNGGGGSSNNSSSNHERSGSNGGGDGKGRRDSVIGNGEGLAPVRNPVVLVVLPAELAAGRGDLRGSRGGGIGEGAARMGRRGPAPWPTTTTTTTTTPPTTTSNDDTANDDGAVAIPEGQQRRSLRQWRRRQNGKRGVGGPRGSARTWSRTSRVGRAAARVRLRAQNEAAALAFAAAAVGENEAGSPVPEARLDENSATRLHQLRNKYADHSQQFIGHKKHSRGVPGFYDPFGQQEPEVSMALSRSVRALDLEGLETHLEGRQIDAHWSLEDSLW